MLVCPFLARCYLPLAPNAEPLFLASLALESRLERLQDDGVSMEILLEGFESPVDHKCPMFSRDPLRNHVVTSWLPHISPRSTAVRLSSARSVADRNAPANPYQAGQAQKRRDRWLNAMSRMQTSTE